MRRTTIPGLVLILLLSALPQWVLAADVQVIGAWARPTPPVAQVAAVYFSIINSGGKADELLSVSTPIAASAEIHDTQTVKGVMQMREVGSVSCPAGATVKIEPGGLHVMLRGLQQPLTEGKRFDLTLRFRIAGDVLVKVTVRNGL